MPGPANLDHVVVAGKGWLEWLIGGMCLNDASHSIINGRHAAGTDKGNRLHRAILSNGDGYQWIRMRLPGCFTDHLDAHVRVNFPGPGLGIPDEFGIGIGAPEEPAAAEQAGRRRTLPGFLGSRAAGSLLVQLASHRPAGGLPPRILITFFLGLRCFVPDGGLSGGLLAFGFAPGCLGPCGFFLGGGLPGGLLAFGFALGCFSSRSLFLGGGLPGGLLAFGFAPGCFSSRSLFLGSSLPGGLLAFGFTLGCFSSRCFIPGGSLSGGLLAFGFASGCLGPCGFFLGGSLPGAFLLLNLLPYRVSISVFFGFPRWGGKLYSGVVLTIGMGWCARFDRRRFLRGYRDDKVCIPGLLHGNHGWEGLGRCWLF